MYKAASVPRNNTFKKQSITAILFPTMPLSRLLLLEVILAEMNELPACAAHTTQEQDRDRKQEPAHDGKGENQQDKGSNRVDSDGDRADVGVSAGPDGNGSTALAVSPGNLQFISEYVKRECNLLLEIDKSEATGQEVRYTLREHLWEKILMFALEIDLGEGQESIGRRVRECQVLTFVC